MTKPGVRRAVRFSPALCAAIAVGLTLSGSAAGAQLPDLPGPVGEAVGAPVGEVTATVEEITAEVVPPVQETTEAATAAVPPVAEVTETVTPPVKEVTETASKVTEEVSHLVQAPAVAAEPAVPSVPPAKPLAVRKPKAPPVGGETSGSGSINGVISSGPPSSKVEPAPTVSPPTEAVSPSTSEPAVVPAPSENGAVRAPLPKWVAYVWPAIALTWRHPAVPTRSRQAAPAASTVTVGHGTGGSQGVAGVHASGGIGAGHHDHSSSPFANIPDAVGGFTSGVPGEALAYLVLVALIVAAVFVAVKVELGRRGSGTGPGH